FQTHRACLSEKPPTPTPQYNVSRDETCGDVQHQTQHRVDRPHEFPPRHGVHEVHDEEAHGPANRHRLGGQLGDRQGSEDTERHRVEVAYERGLLKPVWATAGRQYCLIVDERPQREARDEEDYVGRCHRRAIFRGDCDDVLQHFQQRTVQTLLLCCTPSMLQTTTRARSPWRKNGPGKRVGNERTICGRVHTHVQTMMTMTEMNDPRVWERRCGKGPPGACPRWRHIESSIVGDRGEGSDDDDNSSDEEMGDIESVPLTEEEAQRCRPQRASAETESPRNELFWKAAASSDLQSELGREANQQRCRCGVVERDRRNTDIGPEGGVDGPQ
ncbi:hypothetical protein THAOC_27228, partial [Thalassiosira oceanica]